ncbi:MAG: hypothetical protein NVS2B4_15450 [Ramlibacter sp.]
MPSPVFNYSRDFPFIWEEMIIPISYEADRGRAEAILMEAATRFGMRAEDITQNRRNQLSARFGIDLPDLTPKVYYRITHNWLELTVRFVVGTHRIRDVKDGMSRHIIDALEKAGISIASVTHDIVGFPPIEMKAGARPGLGRGSPFS